MLYTHTLRAIHTHEKQYINNNITFTKQIIVIKDNINTKTKLNKINK